MKIGKETLRFILQISKETYPDEFAALLRERDGIVCELVFLPSHYGERSVFMHLHMMPVDFSVVGTVHSHPTPNPEPSEQDLAFFASTGKYHIITYYPFSERDWVCYNRYGEKIEAEVVDDPEEI